MSRAARNWLLLLVMIVGIVGIDQITKRTVLADLVWGETKRLVPALSPYFQITLSQNRGSAFGFLPQASDLFLVFAVVITIGGLYFYPRIPAEARLQRLAAGLIIGGALGNALDRIQHGYVVDFIHYQIPGFISNVSNLADHAIVLGVGLIFIDSWRMERREKAMQQNQEIQDDESVTPPPNPFPVDGEGESPPAG